MPNPFRSQSWGDGLHATRRRLAAAPVATLGTSTDFSLTEMAKPIKPETMPLGTHTPNLWMTSQLTIPKEKKAGLAVTSRRAYTRELGLKKSGGDAWDPGRSRACRRHRRAAVLPAAPAGRWH